MLSRRQKTIILSLVLALHGIVLLRNLDLLKDLPAKQAKHEVRKKIKLRIVKPEKKKNKKAKQIVNTQKRKEQAKPKEPKYLSHSNQSFERESVASKIGKYKEAGKGKTRKKSVKPAPQVKKVVAKKQSVKPVKKTKNGKLSFSDLAPKMAQVPKKHKPKVSALQGLQNGNKLKKGLSQNNDYVEDVPMGDMTRLNTQEFKYYGFYHRIRVKLEQYWENSLRKKVDSIYKKGRSVASNNQKMTSLRITLDSRGKIVRVAVRASSGVKELDEAAIESFNRAGPFPNPPRGMIINGFAVLDWGFVVKS